jgi:hypothetical protein
MLGLESSYYAVAAQLLTLLRSDVELVSTQLELAKAQLSSGSAQLRRTQLESDIDNQGSWRQVHQWVVPTDLGYLSNGPKTHYSICRSKQKGRKDLTANDL